MVLFASSDTRNGSHDVLPSKERPGIDDELKAGAKEEPYIQAANGNQLALEFLCMWHQYLHLIDDYIDEHKDDPQELLKIFAYANLVYSTPFYSAWARDLRLIVQTVTLAYADSLRWEQDSIEWKRQWADVIRHSGLEMVHAVAAICGGYDNAQRISIPLKEYAYLCHHDADGKPI